MRWTPGGSRDDLEDRRGEGGGYRGMGMGGGGGMRIGLGGMLFLLVLSFIFKQDFLSLFMGGGGPVSSSAPASGPVSSTPQEENTVEFANAMLNDLNKTWDTLLPTTGTRYEHTKLVLFRNMTRTACGYGQAASGPFYCPGDRKVYLDLSFFDELTQRFRASGEFAKAYVIAHEVGHHVQNLSGIEAKVRQLQGRNPGQQNALSVRLELQADCFAGVWGHSTAERNILEEGEAEDGLRAAAAIGDDHIQRMSGDVVSPESFTHGSAAQRVEWLKRGLREGKPSSCNTFAQGAVN